VGWIIFWYFDLLISILGRFSYRYGLRTHPTHLRNLINLLFRSIDASVICMKYHRITAIVVTDFAQFIREGPLTLASTDTHP